MDKENRSKKQLEQEKSLESGYHKWICFDHSHPHLFKDGKCVNCGVVDRTKLKPQVLTKSQIERIAGKLGLELRDENKPREKFGDEVTLPPHLQVVWNYAVNYANIHDMIERGVYKPTLVELDQMKAKKIKLRIDNESGKIVKITPMEEEEEETD